VIDCLVASPPYAESQTTAGNAGNRIKQETWGIGKRLCVDDGYGHAEGQLGAMKPGSVESTLQNNQESIMPRTEESQPANATSQKSAENVRESMQATATVETQTWQGCYDSSWRGAIVPEAFAHPAKAARGLLCRILDFLLEQGYVRRGDTILDPFGGVGTTAIEGASRGLRVVCCELEQRFVDLATGFDCDGTVEGHEEAVSPEPIPAIPGGWFVKLRFPLEYWGADGVGYAGAIPDSVAGFPSKAAATRLARQLFQAQPKGDHSPRSWYTTYHVEPVPAGMSEPGTCWVCDRPARCGKKEEHEAHHVQGNMELHRRTWTTFGDPLPVVLQGDSRQLVRVLGAAGYGGLVSSPPWQDQGTSHDTQENYDKLREAIVRDNTSGDGTRRLGRCTAQDYGQTEGQLGAMPPGEAPAALVSSPPWERNNLQGGATNNPALLDAVERDCNGAWGRKTPFQDYGTTEGQLGSMPPGEAPAALVSSPPWQGSIAGEPRDDNSVLGQQQRGENHLGKGRCQALGRSTEQNYGTTEGQLGAMPAGEAPAALVSSPPFVQSTGGKDSGIYGAQKGTNDYPGVKIGSHYMAGDQGDTPGQLGSMKEGEAPAALVSSPPWVDGDVRGPSHAQSDTPSKEATLAHFEGRGGPAFLDKTYGTTEGQLGTLPPGTPPGEAASAGAEGLVSSPPWEDQAVDHDTKENYWKLTQACIRDGNAHGSLKLAPSVGESYGHAPGQLGNEQGDTFWFAARQIVAQCWHVLKPGAVAVWIVKPFVRNKALVDFPGQWRALCESLGFRTFLIVEASLSKTGRHPSLFGGEETKTVKRQSFFRRLAEKKGSPAIESEIVLFMRRIP
jgi:hypothetical protein